MMRKRREGQKDKKDGSYKLQVMEETSSEEGIKEVKKEGRN